MLMPRLAFLLALFIASQGAIAQKQRIDKAADMPRFSYKVDGSLDALVGDAAAFQRFAQEVRRDTESVLAKYEVADRAAQRQLLGVLAQLDFLEGRYEEAGKRAAEIRALEDKPADKLVSGLQLRSMVAAQGRARDISSAAYRREVERFISEELRAMPYAVIENDIKGAKSGAELLGETMVMGSVSHGTHVAGIAMAGNPYARLAISRIEFNHKLLPDPCPTDELFEKTARNMHAYVEFFRKTGVRVVNMSWGGSVRGYETSLELCGIGPKPEDRKAIARKYFEGQKNALTAAMAGAAGILFVTSAGNSNQDSSFAEAIPAGIVLPNLITVGAVDKAGDEAPFTSYGPTVKVHANGYQVESYLPGGDRVALSGTSMSSPQVANLAAKMLALNPGLKPEDLIRIIVETSEKSADGRRALVHPARAVSAARPG